MTLQAISLFSGVGGIDLAAERAGISPALLCELDKHASSVLARRFPGVPIHPDVSELTPDDLRSVAPDPDRAILLAGFPCTDLSVAGRRLGMGEGTRSGLYWHIPRLLADYPARWVLLENVPGLLSQDRGRAMGAVLGSLADLGYGFAYRVLDSQFFGVPQRRRRVVIVGCLGDSGAAPAQVLLEPEGRDRDSSAGITTRAQAAGRAAASVGGRGREGAVISTLQGGGNRGQRIDAESAASGHLIPMVVNTITAREAKGPDSDATTTLLPMTFQKVIRSGARDADGNLPPEVWAPREIAATLNLHDLGSETRAVDVVVTVLGDKTHALTAEGADASEDGTGRGTPIIAATLTAEVRRLTPLECERLQGHPDGWTDGQSDAQRYRQMGNGVAVPVFEWVLNRLVAVDNHIRSAAA